MPSIMAQNNYLNAVWPYISMFHGCLQCLTKYTKLLWAPNKYFTCIWHILKLVSVRHYELNYFVSNNA